MIGGFSQGAAVALYVAAKLKVEEYFDDSDNEIISRSSKRNSKSIKRRVKRHHRNSIDDQEILDKYYAKTHRSRFKDLTSIKNKEREDIESEEDKNEDASVGAVIFWSGLHLFKKPEKEIFKINKFPIFVWHGIYDEMVDWDYSIRPFMKLSKDYPDIEVNTEEMGHTMSNDEWIQIQNFIQKISWR